MIETAALGVAVLVAATLATAMVAGLLFSFAHSVMPGLGTLDDTSFLTAFQRVDAATANPWMMLTFLGSPVLTLLSLLLLVPGRSDVLPPLVVALGLAAATVGITRAIHLPLNASIQDAAPEFRGAGELRSRFEARWVRWNVVRTLTSTGALAALAWALFIAGGSAG